MTGNAQRDRRAVPGHGRDLGITDLIDKATLQALQDQFTEQYKIANGLLDIDGNPITYERGHCAYCTAVRERTRNGLRLCRESDRVLINTIARTGKPFWHICEGLLLDFGAPIVVGGRTAAFFLWGQLRCCCCQRKSSGISEALKDLGFGRSPDGKRRVVPATARQEYYDIQFTDDAALQTIAEAGLGFTRRLSGMLDKLVQWEEPREIEKFVAQMVQTKDMDSLFDLCVSEIPRLLGTRECSILTVVRERAEAKPKLILQRTTYKDSRHREKRDSYAEGQGLTGWVWKNRRALRINNVDDPREREQYPGLKWSRTIHDSGSHKEWLGVPLFGFRGDVIGVIRVPEKRKNGARSSSGFDLRDEIRLMLLGKHIAHEIELLRASDRTSAALRICQDCAFRLCSAEDGSSVVQTVMDACNGIFGSAGKAHFFNMLDKNDGKLKVEDIRGALTQLCMKQQEVPKGSLSGRCIARGQPIIVHNIPEAKQKRTYFELATGLECAMSAPIRSGNMLFGALSVGANRQYEFAEEPDLHILTDIASLAGAALARLEAEETAQQNLREALRGVGHTLANRIPTLQNWTTVLRSKVRGASLKEIDRLEEGIHFIVGAVEVAKQYGKLAAPMHTVPFDLRAILRRLARMYMDRRIQWSARGPLMMVGNSRLIEQTIVELLDNALRHISKRKGKVEVGAHRSEETIIIRVSDNGPGIPPTRKKQIFRPAVTDDPAAHFGFGLSFVASVVKRHGGTVEECGISGKGASFRIVLPLVNGESKHGSGHRESR